MNKRQELQHKIDLLESVLNSNRRKAEMLLPDYVDGKSVYEHHTAAILIAAFCAGLITAEAGDITHIAMQQLLWSA